MKAEHLQNGPLVQMTQRAAVHTQLAADAIALEFDLHGMYDGDGNTYYQFTKPQTEANLHNKLSGRLIEAGIQTRTDIKIGRSRYNKGNRYAKVTVPIQSVEVSDLVTSRIADKYGIKADCFVTREGILISGVRDQHSATTLFKAFRRFNVRAIAETALTFSLFIPATEPKELLAA